MIAGKPSKLRTLVHTWNSLSFDAAHYSISSIASFAGNQSKEPNGTVFFLGQIVCNSSSVGIAVGPSFFLSRPMHLISSMRSVCFPKSPTAWKVDFQGVPRQNVLPKLQRVLIQSEVLRVPVASWRARKREFTCCLNRQKAATSNGCSKYVNLAGTYKSHSPKRLAAAITWWSIWQGAISKRITGCNVSVLSASLQAMASRICTIFAAVFQAVSPRQNCSPEVLPSGKSLTLNVRWLSKTNWGKTPWRSVLCVMILTWVAVPLCKLLLTNLAGTLPVCSHLHLLIYPRAFIAHLYMAVSSRLITQSSFPFASACWSK